MSATVVELLKSGTAFRLGLPENWPALKEWLCGVKNDEKSPLAALCVRDTKAQRQVDEIRSVFDECVDQHGVGIIGYILNAPSARSAEAEDLVKLLMSFGLDPDVVDGEGRLLLHYVARNQAYRVGSWLLLCRPNSLSTDENGETPVDVIRRQYKVRLPTSEFQNMVSYSFHAFF